MKQADDASSKKENKKVQTNHQFKDNEVSEGTDNSIFKQSNDKDAYPYKQEQDKQHKTQEEYIDRNNDSKDKS